MGYCCPFKIARNFSALFEENALILVVSDKYHIMFGAVIFPLTQDAASQYSNPITGERVFSLKILKR